MIAGNGFEPLAGRPPERRAGFSHAAARLRPVTVTHLTSRRLARRSGARRTRYGPSAARPAGRWFTLGPRVAGSPLMMGEICEWPLGYWWLGSDPLDGPVHRGSPDAEEFRELTLGVASGVVQLQQMLGLIRLQLRLLATQPTLGLGYFHPFPGAQSDQVGFELSATIANTLNNNRPTGSVGSWIEPPRLSLTFRLVSSSMSRASGSDRASRSNLVTTKGVTSPTSSQRQPQTGSIAVAAGQTVVDVDAIITDTKRMQAVALGGEILLLC
jgi:hypothetical protein